MHWLSYLFPLTILKTSSPYNKDIRVLEESGVYKLLCNGARESGSYIALLWRHSFRSFRITRERSIKRILVLGVAGGTVIHELHTLYPDASITGVDIDAVIIDVGKKYFGLGKLLKFHAVCQDAVEYISAGKREEFDCIIVDIFIGPDVPDFVLDSNFERNVKKMLTPGGHVLINYLRQTGYENKAEKLYKLLRSLYENVQSDDIYNNRFFLAQ